MKSFKLNFQIQIQAFMIDLERQVGFDLRERRSRHRHRIMRAATNFQKKREEGHGKREWERESLDSTNTVQASWSSIKRLINDSRRLIVALEYSTRRSRDQETRETPDKMEQGSPEWMRERERERIKGRKTRVHPAIGNRRVGKVSRFVARPRYPGQSHVGKYRLEYRRNVSMRADEPWRHASDDLPPVFRRWNSIVARSSARDKFDSRRDFRSVSPIFFFFFPLFFFETLLPFPWLSKCLSQRQILQLVLHFQVKFCRFSDCSSRHKFKLV